MMAGHPIRLQMSTDGATPGRPRSAGSYPLMLFPNRFLNCVVEGVHRAVGVEVEGGVVAGTADEVPKACLNRA